MNHFSGLSRENQKSIGFKSNVFFEDSNCELALPTLPLFAQVVYISDEESSGEEEEEQEEEEEEDDGDNSRRYPSLSRPQPCREQQEDEHELHGSNKLRGKSYTSSLVGENDVHADHEVGNNDCIPKLAEEWKQVANNQNPIIYLDLSTILPPTVGTLDTIQEEEDGDGDDDDDDEEDNHVEDEENNKGNQVEVGTRRVDLTSWNSHCKKRVY